MPHPLIVRLLRNRASFYQELLERLPWEKLRGEIAHAATNLPELSPPASDVVTEAEEASSPLLLALQLDEWLKKDDIGVPRARRIISVESALDEACHLERVGILLCSALSEAKTEDSENLRLIRSAHTRAFLALCELRDRLEYHRLTLLNLCMTSENNRLG